MSKQNQPDRSRHLLVNLWPSAGMLFRRAGILFLFCVVFALSNVHPGLVFAQSTDEEWEKPLNLSHSGGATLPFIIPGDNGVLHVLWVDRYDGMVYRRFNGAQWEAAQIVPFPFGIVQRGSLRVTQLHFFPGAEGLIHALWVDQDGRLLYSRVTGENFEKVAAWTPPELMAESAVAYSMVIDAQGSLHLAYVRVLQSSTLPAGIYYKRSTDNGFNWTQAALIYRSSYFRDLVSELANIQIDSAGPDSLPWIYVSWDNRPRKQVFLAISKDRGMSWGTPIEVDRSDASLGSSLPFHLQVNAHDQQVLLTWQVGDPGSMCTQLYQWSEDGGETWSDSQPVFQNMSGCPQEVRLIHDHDHLTYMALDLQGQVYLLAWDGKRWSALQPQIALNSFVDEEAYNLVYFGCRVFAYLPVQKRLLVIGCDTGGGGDIWLTSRSMGSIDDWYPPEPIWTDASRVSSSNLTIQSPVLVADSGGGMHVFWSQEDLAGTANSESGDAFRSSIYYALWNGERWIVPGTILATVEGKDVRPVVTLDAEGRLLAVWNNGQLGEMFFSWANAARALNPSEWANPLLLPLPKPGGRSPAILAEPTGRVDLAYAVPLNEGRGIYLLTSDDLGKSWSSPQLVFDGVAAGWEMVDQPRLAYTADGRLHVLWTRLTIPSGSGVLGLYYSFSEDGGKSWSQAREVVGKPVMWSGIVTSGGNRLHRFWQESSRRSANIWHELSSDGGDSWNQPEIVSSFFGATGLASITVDEIGRLHLIQIAEKGEGNFIVQHSVWSSEGWSTYENAELGQGKFDNVDGIYAAVSAAGKLGVVISGQRRAESPDQFEEILYFTERKLDISTGQNQSRATPLARATETPLPTETPAPQPTPTLDLANLGPVQPRLNIPFISGEYGGLILGIGLVAMIIALIIGYRFLISRFSR